MPHEQRSPAEHEKSPEARPVFDFEQMEPAQAATLVNALAFAEAKYLEQHDGSYDVNPYDWLLNQADVELVGIARTSDKALNIYTALMNETADRARSIAAAMAPDLLRRNLDESAARLKIINPLVAAVNGEYSLARETAEHMLTDIAYSDWLDEPTARYLASELPEE